jgi:hypothetical protein
VTELPPYGDALAGAWCKFYRAVEHLQTLAGEVSDFMTPDSYRLEVDTEVVSSEGDRRRVILRRRVFFAKQPDSLRWGVLAGDIVGNLRAALDHAIYAISMARDPLAFAADATTEFPITDHRDAFDAARRRSDGKADPLRGLNASAARIVEALQPFQCRLTGGDVRNDPLWLLREMSNIDKHRTIHMSTWCAYQIEWDITQLFPGTRIHRQWMHPLEPLASGAVIAEIEFSYEAASQQTMLMDRHISFTVTLNEGDLRKGNLPLPNVLDELAQYVYGVLASLERFAAPKG